MDASLAYGIMTGLASVLIPFLFASLVRWFRDFMGDG